MATGHDALIGLVPAWNDRSSTILSDCQARSASAAIKPAARSTEEDTLLLDRFTSWTSTQTALEELDTASVFGL